MLIFILAVQGAVLFAGIALGINALVLQGTNWFFIIVMTLIGAILGGVIGALVRRSSPSAAWLMPVGSLVVALLVGGLSIAFDYFVFGGESMHWRGIISAAMISSAPGLILGWLIAQQYAGGKGPVQPPRRAKGQAEEAIGRRRLRQGPPPPAGALTDESGNTQRQQLRRVLESETQEILGLSDGATAEVTDVRDAAGSMCVTVGLPGQRETLRLYLVCSPRYPEQAPQLMAEVADRRQPNRTREIPVESQVIARWNAQSRLRDVVEEVAHTLAR